MGEFSESEADAEGVGWLVFARKFLASPLGLRGNIGEARKLLTLESVPVAAAAFLAQYALIIGIPIVGIPGESLGFWIASTAPLEHAAIFLMVAISSLTMAINWRILSQAQGSGARSLLQHGIVSGVSSVAGSMVASGCMACMFALTMVFGSPLLLGLAALKSELTVLALVLVAWMFCFSLENSRIKCARS